MIKSLECFFTPRLLRTLTMITDTLQSGGAACFSNLFDHISSEYLKVLGSNLEKYCSFLFNFWEKSATWKLGLNLLSVYLQWKQFLFANRHRIVWHSKHTNISTLLKEAIITNIITFQIIIRTRQWDILESGRSFKLREFYFDDVEKQMN